MNKLPEKFSIRALTPELSKTIQERLFEHGCKWASHGRSASFTDKPWLDIGAFDSSRVISWNPTAFNSTILTIEQLFSIPVTAKFKTVNGLPWSVEMSEEFVDIGCQTGIKRADFDKTLEEIKSFRETKSSLLLGLPWYIDVLSPELSKVIQEKLFSLGCSWVYSGKVVSERKVDGILFHSKLGYFDGYRKADEHLEEFQNILKNYRKIALEELFSENSTVLESKSIRFGSVNGKMNSGGVRIDGKDITWEQYDKFLEELKK